VNLQNKAVKFLKTSKKATLDEMHMQNKFLTISNSFVTSLVTLCTLLKRTFIHHILTSILNLLRQFIMFPPDLQLPTISSYPEEALQGQCFLKFIVPKLLSERPDHINFWSLLDFKHLYKN